MRILLKKNNPIKKGVWDKKFSVTKKLEIPNCGTVALFGDKGLLSQPLFQYRY